MHDRRPRGFLGIVALACLAAATCCCARAASQLGPVRDAHIDAAVRFVMNDRHIAGLALGIERSGHILAIRTYGSADPASRRPVDAQTVFAIGSLTKSFTAAIVRELVRKGRLRDDVPVSQYLPEYPAAAGATIDELLAQTAGLPDYALAPGFSPASRLPVGPDALVALAAEQAQLPPDTFAYANTNYLLAALIAQRAAGVPYAMLLQRSVLRPLHLRRTSIANSFVPMRDRARGDAPPGSATLGFGCADLQSDIPDLLAWAGALFAGDVVPAPRSNPPYDDGFFATTTFDRPVVFASGYVPGFSAYWLAIPDARVSVILLSNAGAVDLGPLARSVAAAALQIRDSV